MFNSSSHFKNCWLTGWWFVQSHVSTQTQSLVCIVMITQSFTVYQCTASSSFLLMLTDTELLYLFTWSHNQPLRGIRSALNPSPLSWPAGQRGLIDVQLTAAFHCRLLYMFNTRGFPLCPVVSSAGWDLTRERAPVSNKDHCLTCIGMLVWTTGICCKGSLCLVHHSGPLGVCAVLSIKQIIAGFSRLPWALARESQDLDLNHSINKLSRCVMHKCVSVSPATKVQKIRAG